MSVGDQWDADNGDALPDAPDLSDEAFRAQFPPIAAEPGAHEAHEIAVALYTLQHADHYGADAVAWARGVIERYRAR